ncbi:MAG: hypothetical protein IPO66_23655 [Rhodanobacteraceae bacterium]|nr:hypothetical protein [Rhodanobacteraceae bacterium]
MRGICVRKLGERWASRWHGTYSRALWVGVLFGLVLILGACDARQSPQETASRDEAPPAPSVADGTMPAPMSVPPPPPAEPPGKPMPAPDFAAAKAAEPGVVASPSVGGDATGNSLQTQRGNGAEQVAAQQALRVQNDAVELYGKQRSGANKSAAEALSGGLEAGRLQAAGERLPARADAEKRQNYDKSDVDGPAEDQLDTVVVTGSRIRRVTEETALPVSVLDVAARSPEVSATMDDQLASGTAATSAPAAASAPAEPAPQPPAAPSPPAPAAGFASDARTVTPDLKFQEASGYWANTYVPGDPTIRLLESRLRGAQTPIIDAEGRVLNLDSASRQYVQPFDLPENAALVAYLHADQRGIAGPTRLLVQVGLQGTLRASGLRPAMNVGVVLDLTGPISADVSAGMRALLAALNAAKQTGDRISLTVAGVPGGVIVGADDFKHGTIAVVTRQIFGSEPAPGAPVLDLAQALSAATLAVSQSDDPSAQLGASLVLLVTGNALADPGLGVLEEQAHRSAVGGIPLSVVGVGGAVDLAAIDRLTLAGQGNRRLLANPSEAPSVVDRELHSASRVIARAVRLRIRLAPGVRLVEVISSNKLDEGHATRVREAEVSVDRRLAKNLGIEADRGEDEEGIQMVIPAYYAGDAHVVLLDVVADRPGAIADVTVRYKDLVFLRNGVAQANLSMGSLPDAAGPLERNVLKNLLAMRLSAAILRAGEYLEQGAVDAADALLADNLQQLEHARRSTQGWENDVEIKNDIAMINEYRSALRANADAIERERVADSLRYAGYLKVQARRR